MTLAALWRQATAPESRGARDALVAGVAVGAPLIVATVLAFLSGGYFISSWGIAAMVLLALVAALALAGASVGGRLGLIALAGWALLAAWQGISMAWADDPARARNVMGLTLLYLAALALPMMGLRKRSWLPRASEGALAVSVVVVGAGVAARLFPGFGEDPTARLSWPVGYWNALGALAAFGLVLAIGIGASSTRHSGVRGVALGMTPLLALGLLMTLSRGAFVVAAIGLVLLVALSPGRVETVVAGVLALVVSAPALAYANDQPGLVALQGELPDHSSEGLTAAGLTVLGMVLAGLAGAFVPMATGRLDDARRRVAGYALAGAGVVVLVVAAAAFWPSGGPIAAADRQFDSFREFSPGDRGTSDSISDRLAVAAGSGRWQNWEVAGQEFESAPIVGTGAGDYVFWWNAERTIDVSVVNAHSLFLEVLGESGLIGLVLLLIPIGIGAFAIGRALLSRPPPALARDLGLVAAATATMIVHAGIDWDWQLPAVILPAVVLGGAGLRASLSRDGDGDGGSRLDPAAIAGRGVAAIGAVVAIALLIGPTIASHEMASARELAREGDITGALSKAESAAARDPQSSEPPLLEANLYADLGESELANQRFADALARSPADWVILADWAVALERQGQVDDAALLLSRALELNPRESRVQLLSERIDAEQS